MAEIIYLDENGKEINRVPKKKGRPPKGEVDSFGNITVRSGKAIIKSPEQTKENKKIPEEKNIDKSLTEKISDNNSLPEKEITTEPVKRKNRAITGNSCITMEYFIKSVLPMSVIINDGVSKLRGACIINKFGGTLEANLPYNSIFECMEIDTKNNIIKVWTLPSSSPASRIHSYKNQGINLTSEQEKEEHAKGFLYTDPSDVELKNFLLEVKGAI